MGPPAGFLELFHGVEKKTTHTRIGDQNLIGQYFPGLSIIIVSSEDLSNFFNMTVFARED